MHTLANNEDPDEMLHDAAFHQGLHYLLRQINIQRIFYNFYLEIITCDPSIYTMAIPSLLNQARRKNPLVYKGLMGIQTAMDL